MKRMAFLVSVLWCRVKRETDSNVTDRAAKGEDGIAALTISCLNAPSTTFICGKTLIKNFQLS